MASTIASINGRMIVYSPVSSKRITTAVIGARVIYGSQPMVPYRADETAQHAPTVNFGNGQ